MLNITFFFASILLAVNGKKSPNTMQKEKLRREKLLWTNRNGIGIRWHQKNVKEHQETSTFSKDEGLPSLSQSETASEKHNCLK